MIQQAFKYVSLSLWPHLMFCELKISSLLKSSGCGLEKSENLPREQNFFIAVGAFPVILLAYQVSMVCVTNWLLDSSIYIPVLDIKLG